MLKQKHKSTEVDSVEGFGNDVVENIKLHYAFCTVIYFTFHDY